MKEAYWRHTLLRDIDPTSQVNHLPLTSMYMGAKITCLLISPEYQQPQRTGDIKYFLSKVQEFYIEAAIQRFPVGDPLIEMFEILDHNTPNIHSKYPSFAPLAAFFPNLVPDTQLQVLDNEWRQINLCDLSTRIWILNNIGELF